MPSRKPLLRRIPEPLFVALLAAAAGAFLHIWHELVIRVLPNSVAICTNAHHDGITLACEGTLLGNMAAFITLFSATAYVSYLLYKKSQVLAYYFGGYLAAALLFFKAALALNLAAVYELRWLFGRHLLWINWIFPALLAALGALLVYALGRYGGNKAKLLLAILFIVLIIGTLWFMPGFVNSLVAWQAKHGLEQLNSAVPR
jgi:hypothetical protein